MGLLLRTNSTLAVLIVDDEPEIRELITDVLKSMKCFSFIIEASDGRDALQKVGLQEFDIVITDLSMPRLEGISFIDLSRKNPNLKECTFLVISGDVTSHALKQAMELGVKSIVTKPFSADGLESSIKKILLETKKDKIIITDD